MLTPMVNTITKCTTEKKKKKDSLVTIVLYV